jgi:DNA-binding MarR family transcriptional regulator
VIEALHVSKQAAGQLVDTLVARGYLERTVDPEDRRRLVVHLTERGVAAAEASHDAVEQVDRRLVEAVGEDVVSATRRGLVALIDLAEH